MRETRIGNTFSKFTAIHRPWGKLHGGIFRYKTFCMRVLARRTFLRFRYCSIHVKMHVLLTYSAVKHRVSMGSRNLVPAVSPMSGSLTFDTEKKEDRKIERGEFITPPRPTGRRSNQGPVFKRLFYEYCHSKCANTNLPNSKCVNSTNFRIWINWAIEQVLYHMNTRIVV